MEDVALFVKQIENGQLRRPADPEAKEAWARMLRRGAVVVLLLAICFGPRAWLRHSSYRIAQMTEQKQSLTGINHHLRVRQAQLSDLRRVGILAAASGLEAPPPENYAWQDRTISPAPEGPALARLYGGAPDSSQ